MAIDRDLLNRVKNSRLAKAISKLDRDPYKQGFQLTSGMASPLVSSARQPVSTTSSFGPIKSVQNGLQRAELSKIKLSRGFGEGVSRVKQAIKDDPLQFTPLSMRERVGQVGQGSLFSQGLRGALGATPFQRPGEKLQASAPQTQAQKNAATIGRTGVLTAMTAPLGGSNMLANVATRGIQGAVVGGGFGAGAALLTGNDPIQGAKQGVLSGLKAAPILAATNPVTTKIIGSVLPGLGFKASQITQRTIAGIANTLEDELLSKLDGITPDNQQRLTSFAIAALMTGNRQAYEQLTPELKTWVKAKQRPVTTMKQNRKTGERITMPMWKYEIQKLGFGMSTQDINDLSPEDYAKVKNKSTVDASSGTKPMQQDIEQPLPPPGKVESSRSNQLKKLEQKSKLQTFRQGKPIQGGLEKPLKVRAQGKVDRPNSGSSSVSITRDGKYAFNINKKKLGLNKEQSKQLDDVVEVMRPVLQKNKGKTLTKAEIVEGGRKAKVLQDVVGRDDAKKFSESLQASRNLLKSEQSQVGITPKFLEQLEVVSSVAADAGRRLQAFNIGAEDITIKEKVLADILKTGATADEVLKAGRQVDWNDAKQVTDFYRKFKPATLFEKLDEFRYTNMLSSPNTHINNSFSNLLQSAVLAPIEKTVRGGLSFAQSRLTGKEQEYFARQGVDYTKGYWKSLPEALAVFKKTMSGDVNLNKPDVDLLPTSTSKLRQLYTTPLRALEASDQFFRTLIKGGELESLKTQGITGAKASKLAENEADYRVFRQAFDPEGKMGQGGLLKLWDKYNSSINNLRRLPGARWIIPFLQTPTNILKQGFEYSPFGVATIPGAKDPLSQLTKSIIGTGVFTGAYALADSGMTTWDAPTNSNERAEFYAAGLQPYSVKIGDKWVAYSKIGPLAYPIAMASALKWAQDNDGDEDTLAKAGAAIGGTLGFFADQSYMRGIGDIIDAFRGDEYKQARGLGNIPSQLVPYRAAMGWIARQVDPVYRKTSGGSIPEQIGKSIISQVPFASKSLEAYQTPFNEDSQRQFPGVNAVSPLSISKERPKEKEYYDARNSMRKENKKVDNILKKIENGKNVSIDDGLLTSQAVSLIKKKIEAGIEVNESELETAYLNKPLTMPKSNRYEQGQRKSKLLSSSGTIMDDENLSDAQKEVLQNKIAKELGYTPEQLDTYHVAKQDNNAKTLYALDQIDTFTAPDELMRYLVNGRKPINNQLLVSDGVIDNLVSDGLIPYELGKQLKKLDLDENGKLKIKQSSGGKGKTSARSKAEKKYLQTLAKISSKPVKIKTTQSQTRVGDIKGITFGDSV